MSNEELKKSIEALEKFTRELTSSKEKGMEYFVKAGTHTPTGQLTDRAKQSA